MKYLNKFNENIETMDINDYFKFKRFDNHVKQLVNDSIKELDIINYLIKNYKLDNDEAIDDMVYIFEAVQAEMDDSEEVNIYKVIYDDMGEASKSEEYFYGLIKALGTYSAKVRLAIKLKDPVLFLSTKEDIEGVEDGGWSSISVKEITEEDINSNIVETENELKKWKKIY